MSCNSQSLWIKVCIEFLMGRKSNSMKMPKIKFASLFNRLKKIYVQIIEMHSGVIHSVIFSILMNIQIEHQILEGNKNLNGFDLGGNKSTKI